MTTGPESETGAGGCSATNRSAGSPVGSHPKAHRDSCVAVEKPRMRGRCTSPSRASESSPQPPAADIAEYPGMGSGC